MNQGINSLGTPPAYFFGKESSSSSELPRLELNGFKISQEKVSPINFCQAIPKGSVDCLGDGANHLATSNLISCRVECRCGVHIPCAVNPSNIFGICFSTLTAIASHYQLQR